LNANYYLNLELSQNLKSNVRKISEKPNLKIVSRTLSEENAQAKDYSEPLAGRKGFYP